MLYRNSAVRNMLLPVGLALVLGSCHVVTDTELSRIRSEGQRHGPDAAQVLTDQLIPYADKHAQPAAQVVKALSGDFDEACRQFGFHQSDAFPCNFWIRVQGKVSRIDNSSRVGKTYVELAETGDGKPISIALETGPVIIGTGVRDGFPNVKYSDFDDQTRFAEFAKKINKLVVARMQKSLKIKVGDQVDVVAVYSSWSAPTGEIRAIPVAWK